MPPDVPWFEVEFYREPGGTKPVADWLRQIRASNPDLAERCKAALRRLAFERAYHRPPHTQSLDDGLLELRVLGSDGARFLFFYAGDRRVVIVHGFVKKTQKLPEADRRTALRAMETWRRTQHGSRETNGSPHP